DATSVHTYKLTFTTTGDFTYYCVVHGRTMRGTVHVRPAGTAYPHTQKAYDSQARKATAKILADGRALRSRAAEQATSHRVFIGAADETAMVM
ncbi:hypothetical protein NL319_27500, partial [Klebsiella pneumoniae]|nr:hypothetical protein [Klebsiella pneumoniae]